MSRRFAGLPSDEENFEEHCNRGDLILGRRLRDILNGARKKAKAA
ncbi:MAG: hypothetical protein ACKV22_33235 [Bryobacteraceae bacterium]